MHWYIYRKAVKEDFQEYVETYKEEISSNEEDFQTFFDRIEDWVTAKNTGSYYCDRAYAEQCVLDVVFDGDAFEALVEIDAWGDFTDEMANQNPEGADVVVRCAALHSVRDELEEWFNDFCQKS